MWKPGPQVLVARSLFGARVVPFPWVAAPKAVVGTPMRRQAGKGGSIAAICRGNLGITELAKEAAFSLEPGRYLGKLQVFHLWKGNFFSGKSTHQGKGIQSGEWAGQPRRAVPASSPAGAVGEEQTFAPFWVNTCSVPRVWVQSRWVA